MSRPTILVAAALALAWPSAGRAELLAITHARAWTMTGDRPIEDATIAIRDGRIVSVQSGGTPDAGARVIDAHGRVVTPALVHPATQIGLGEVGSIVGGEDQRVGAGPLGPSFDPALAIDANAQTVRQARADGVSRALVYPDGSGTAPFDGVAAIVRLRSGPDILERRGVAMVATVSGPGASGAGGSRAGEWGRLRLALDETREVAAHAHAADVPGRLLNQADARALGPVVAGTMPLMILTDRESDIRQAIALGRDYRLRIVLMGAAEAWRAAAAIAAAHVPVILDPLDNLPSSYDQIGARRDNAALLARAGVVVAFSVSGQGIYRSYDAGPSLREGAGFAVANGMPYADALAAITVTPARLWAMGDGAGTLAPGGAADLVIWDGDPLEPSTAPALVVMDGREVSPTTRQTMLRDRYAPQR